MKTLLLLIIAILAGTSPKPVTAQTLPNCISGNSDSDGDGYGWENGESCIVQQNRCEDRGDFPWGWDPVTETSCRLDQAEQTVQAAQECPDSDGDGWGWNGVESCRVTEFVNEAGECIDVLPLFDGWGWNGVASCITTTDTPLIRLPVLDTGQLVAGNTRIHLSDDASIAVYSRYDLNQAVSFYVPQVYLTTLADSTDTLISANAEGMEANANSSIVGISGDAQTVLFSSSAYNLRDVPIDSAQVTTFNNSSQQLYLYDRTADSLTLITTGPDGLPGANNPYGSRNGVIQRISADGNFIAYVSDATNLVPDDRNGMDDVFQFNAVTGVNTLLSKDFNDPDLDGDSFLVDQSANGRYVLFGTRARPFVKLYYLYDSVSRTATALQFEIVSASNRARISNDGLIVVDNYDDIQLFDPQTNTMVQLDIESPAWDGTFRGFNVRSADPEISPNGRYVAYLSKKENLLGNETIPVDSNNLYLLDRLNGVTTLVSRSASGSGASADIEEFQFTRDGRKLYFRTGARNLIPPGDNDPKDDWFVFDIGG